MTICLKLPKLLCIQKPIKKKELSPELHNLTLQPWLLAKIKQDKTLLPTEFLKKIWTQHYHHDIYLTLKRMSKKKVL